MKLSIIGTASLLFGAALGIVEGQDRPVGRGPRGPEGDHHHPANFTGNLSGHFAALAAYDTDKNGKLDDTEQAAVAAAIDAGTPDNGPPRSGKGEGKPASGRPPGDVIAGHAAKLYESLATYDVDKSGALDEAEQAAVAKAVTDGSLKLRHPGGPGGPRGPRGERPGSE